MLAALRHTPRLARAALALARHDDLWPRDRGPAPRWLHWAGRLARLGSAEDRPAGPEGLAQTLRTLGPAYVKLGQLLATRPDIVGPHLAQGLMVLQDRLPPFETRAAEATIVQELGQPLHELFESLGTPVAAASIAQVYSARVPEQLGHNRLAAANDAPPRLDGRRAVKVLRPGIEEAFNRDLEGFRWAAATLERWNKPARRLEPIKLVETLADSVALELDLRLEGAAADEFSANVRSDPGFRVPAVDWQRTARRVLTLEWVDGIPLADRAALVAAGHNTAQLATTLMQSFLTHALRDGFFHADLHQGNLFVDADGTLVAVDFGIMGRLDPASRRYLAEILYGFLRRDYPRIAAVHFEAGYVPNRHAPEAFAQALRAIGEPILGRNASDISMARLLAQLFETTALFDMHLRPELVLLQKTMVVAEGVARSLDPEHNLWEAARPVLERFMARELGPEGRLQTAAEGAATLGKIASHLPALLAGVERAVSHYASRGLTLDPQTVEALAEAQARAGARGRLERLLLGLALIASLIWLLA